MASLYTETARFKWPGHKNEACFFRNTLLARAVQGFGTEDKNLHRVFVTLVGLAGVRREDIEAVWEVTQDFMVWRNDEDLSPEGRSQEGQMGVIADDTWEDLEEILDMNEAEFEARYRKDMREKFGVELDSDDSD